MVNKYEMVKRRIKAGQGLRAFTNGELATKAHIGSKTLDARFAKPHNFTLEELVSIERALNITLLNPDLDKM